jgi:uncharacterized protein YrrD
MTDPVSWFVVERNWEFFGSEGEQVGTVEGVVGDVESDIFSGLRVAFTLLKAARFIPAEYVASILDGEVHLALTSAEARESRFPEPGESRHDH